MKYVLKAFAVLVLFTMFSGCIEYGMLIKVDKNGSGTIEQKLVMSKAVMEMLKQFPGSSQSEQGKDIALYDVESLKNNAAKFGKGVTFEGSQKISGADGEGYSAIYKFNNVNDLRLDNDPGSQISLAGFENDELSDDSTADDYTLFSFTKGNPSVLVISQNPDYGDNTDTTIAEETDTVSADSELTDEAVNTFKGLRISIVVQTDGKVIETDASYSDKNAITLLDIDFEKIIKNKANFAEFGRLQKADDRNAKALLKKIDGVKVELKDKVTVKFE